MQLRKYPDYTFISKKTVIKNKDSINDITRARPVKFCRSRLSFITILFIYFLGLDKIKL